MKLFKRKKKAKKNLFEVGDFNLKNENLLKETKFLVSLAYKSYSIDTIYPACASCYGISLEKNKEYKERLAYIGRRVKAFHTSILEHSNVVIQVYVPLEDNMNILYSAKNENKYINDELIDINNSNQDILSMIFEVTDNCRYLTKKSNIVYDDKNSPMLKITIGGSIRGYRYIFENIKNRNNRLFISIFNVLKRVIEPEFFLDFINDGVMEEYTTIDIYNNLYYHIPPKITNNIELEKINILNMDDLINISMLTRLPLEDCFDFVTISVEFKNMSRIITQQVTRHRNAITQESQRYVNYSGTKVNAPYLFKDKYDKNHKYKTPLGDLTFDELGELIASVYPALLDQKVDKEDARGYLPLNVQCGKLFMTFTLRTLFSFLNLRLDPHAQAEVREYANIIAENTEMYSESLGVNDMSNASNIYTMPIYKRAEMVYDDVEEEV